MSFSKNQYLLNTAQTLLFFSSGAHQGESLPKKTIQDTYSGFRITVLENNIDPLLDLE